MKPAKFTLEHLFYPELSTKANQDFTPGDETSPTEPTLKFYLSRTGENSFNLGLRLGLSAEVPSDKYSIEAFAVGVFLTDETLQEEQQVKLIAQSGPNLVYAALRDMVATLTGRGPWGEYYLQPKIIEPGDFVGTEGSGLTAD